MVQPLTYVNRHAVPFSFSTSCQLSGKHSSGFNEDKEVHKCTQTRWQNKLHLRLQHRLKAHPVAQLSVFLKKNEIKTFLKLGREKSERFQGWGCQIKTHKNINMTNWGVGCLFVFVPAAAIILETGMKQQGRKINLQIQKRKKKGVHLKRYLRKWPLQQFPA